MEASPLIKAHDHAKAASAATQTSDTTVAVSEHALAAGEFSNATKSTASVEALRTLKLLEQHHRRLSELLKYPLEHPVHQPTDSDGAESSEKAPLAPEGAAAETGRAKQDLRSKAGGGQAPQQRRYPPTRELSSSIASNLASARGIRSKHRGQPLAPSISADQAPGSMDSLMRKDGSRAQMQSMLHQKGSPSWVPPSHPTQTADAKPGETSAMTTAEPPSASEEGYSRFYNTFGSLLNRLSAPLGFAGLPLIAEEPSVEPAPAPEPVPQRRSRAKSSGVSSPDPQLSKIYSGAALRALALARDPQNPNDSFYVVPKTGHTASYANILTFDQKEKRRMAASLHGDDELLADIEEDDFVDANEPQAPLPPGFQKRLGRNRSEKELRNVVEELYTENQGLKNMLDKLSKRLHAFEANAQNSHMALQESIRFMRPGSPLSSSGGKLGSGSGGGGGGGSDDASKKKIAELETELAVVLKQNDTLEKQNDRLQKNLDVYRDKWEKLKAGAKARREAQGSTTSAEPSK